MLTGKMVRVRFARDRINPRYLEDDSAVWLEAAERLLELFREQEGRTRGELEEELKDTFGDDPDQIVHQGLAKLLEDRCEFEVAAGQPPEKLRELVFRAAAFLRRTGEGGAFDRDGILRTTALQVEMTPEEVDRGLFADLKNEQRLKRFKDISAERLLQRYNVALAQAVLLRSIRVQTSIRGETPQRYRQLFRAVKFHRLVCEVQAAGPGAYNLNLDGPLSLFSATQKYGLQLALFLPALLLCKDFELQAELRWGTQRKPKNFFLTPKDGLVSHLSDTGTYVPPELTMFAELFRKKVADWDLVDETGILPLGNAFWVPDYRLVHRVSGRIIYLEILGFWRRSSVEQHLERLRQHAGEPFLLAVSERLHVEDADLEGFPSGVHRFRQMPLPDEIVRLADALLEPG